LIHHSGKIIKFYFIKDRFGKEEKSIFSLQSAKRNYHLELAPKALKKISVIISLKKFHALFSTEADYITFFKWRKQGQKILQRRKYKSIHGYCINYFITTYILPLRICIIKEKDMSY
jgi:hypothetical protein